MAYTRYSIYAVACKNASLDITEGSLVLVEFFEYIQVSTNNTTKHANKKANTASVGKKTTNAKAETFNLLILLWTQALIY